MRELQERDTIDRHMSMHAILKIVGYDNDY